MAVRGQRKKSRHRRGNGKEFASDETADAGISRRATCGSFVRPFLIFASIATLALCLVTTVFIARLHASDPDKPRAFLSKNADLKSALVAASPANFGSDSGSNIKQNDMRFESRASFDSASIEESCTVQSGYANSVIAFPTDSFGVSSPQMCAQACMRASANACNCWSFKLDGFCRVGLSDSCQKVGSDDDFQWKFGTCRTPTALRISSNSLAPVPLPVDAMPVAPDVHTFYYMWYASLQVDGRWAHWNHEVIPHWDKNLAPRFAGGKHNPDEGDIGSTFWPELGPYSSMDAHVVSVHMKQMRAASIGVAVLSWYPPRMHDAEGFRDHDVLLTMLLDVAKNEGMEVAIHIEPYKGRTPESVRDDIADILQKYGDHPALHRRLPTGRHLKWLKQASPEVIHRRLPLIYVYDSYHNLPASWAELLTPTGSISIRGTPLDAIMLCLWVERPHESYLEFGGFDGAYTYFAADGMVYGSSSANWPAMAANAKRHGTMFVPSVGPGYNDKKVRPWNQASTRKRDGGKYFTRLLEKAVRTAPDVISLTSWNEWHEGTNIEPSVRRQGYEDYDDAGGPNAYLDLVRVAMQKWTKLRHPDRIQSGVVAFNGDSIHPPSANIEHQPSPRYKLSTVQDAVWASRDHQFTGVHPPSKANPTVIPILIITHARAHYLRRALDSVFKHRKLSKDYSDYFPVTASQDGGNIAVANLLKEALAVGNISRHLRFQPKLNLKTGYQRLCAHYAWAFTQMFSVFGHEHLVVLEEDLEVAPDIFSYFTATLPILKSDKHLFCVSAWNDNGKKQLASNARAIFRSDFFPGLGWMLLRSFWEEIRPRWPDEYWDDFIRRGDVRKGRHCLRPEVSRTYTFGETGVSSGQFFHQHLSSINLNKENVDWTAEDLAVVATTGSFDTFLRKEITQAVSASIGTLTQTLSAYPSKAVKLKYDDRFWGQIALRFGLMEDEKDGIRRGSYRGVLPITWSDHRVYLFRDWPE
eukprot:TRINITY_DN74218_c0_g1_i1.p1 TRINITY_DN74218_c0_g1~~TRINITY_DN74218_c0_g1_i1.p1  ORF type:complete len:981 (+),score=106.05 TRINITY_DN74218_c0_g1_i1:74-3016(+)